ncbi:MAG: S-methyl-5'-thioinosine phosphorylase [Gammaproteobacteria bacterium]|nr:S-methyl-5'-thioinosine phosphorylase [Gammaproteobacteria bacterium]
MIGILSGSAGLGARIGDVVTQAETPWGMPSTSVRRVHFDRGEALVLNRHGEGVRIAPHAINYRANVHALKSAGAEALIALHTAGGINLALPAGALLLPDQIVDYTWSRLSTYADDTAVHHIEFAEPFDAALCHRLEAAAAKLGIMLHVGGVYGCTQGPRLETAAEINRLERDGCDVVGMTAMPEAALARELGMPYASLCVVVNPAAGRGRIEFAEIRRLSSAAAHDMTLLLNACL